MKDERTTLESLRRLYRPLVLGTAPRSVSEAVCALSKIEAVADNDGLLGVVTDLRTAVLGPYPFNEELARQVATASAIANRTRQIHAMPANVATFFKDCQDKPFMKVLRDAAAGVPVTERQAEKALLSTATHALIQEEQADVDFSGLISFVVGSVGAARAGRKVDNVELAAALFEGRLVVLARAGVLVKGRRER